MRQDSEGTSRSDIQAIVDSARRMGVELNEAEALRWLAEMAAWKNDSPIDIDSENGVFGHKVSMLDFRADDLARFRQVGRLVEIPAGEGVETALALSGSAAQCKIQTYPGDCDYFQRVNIHADSGEEACRILAGLMRAKALDTLSGPDYRLLEVKFGSYPEDVVRDGVSCRQGSPISWHPEEIRAARIVAQTQDGSERIISWSEVLSDPGWCKLDWVVADPVRGTLANASNMLDVTWEGPDGSITPLDGYLDPYFQEVYLDAEAIPIFAKLARHVSADALDWYVERLEKEVAKYVTGEPNFGKAAKRLYNIFRLTGRYHEAAFLRELFDEPATILYQVWSLIRTLEEASAPGSLISHRQLVSQADDLIVSATKALEGEEEVEIVRHLLRLREVLGEDEREPDHESRVLAAQALVINIVNNFFRERLLAVPEIREYLAQFLPAPSAHNE